MAPAKPPWLFDPDGDDSGEGDYKYDSRLPWEKLDPKKGVPAWEALFHFVDRRRAAELFDLDLGGYGDLSNADPLWWPDERREFDTKNFWHRHGLMELNARLLGKLRRGELVAHGYSNQAPLDAPRRLIAAERWLDLGLDSKSSTASGPGIEVTQIRIYLPGPARDRRFDAARKSHSPSALRKWYVERLELCARAGRIPSREEDYKDANARFGGAVSKRAVEDLRRELAPASWTRKGRRVSR